MHHTVKLLTIIIAACSITLLSACSHFKSNNKTAQQGNAQTSGIDIDDDDGFAYEHSGNRLKAPYNQTYHFDLDKYVVHQEDIPSINVQAGYLIKHPSSKIRLEGNADERGSREYNIALGWKRAKAVADLLKQQGVCDTQIAMVSYGKEKPVAFGHDELSYGKNRRVDLIYESK